MKKYVFVGRAISSIGGGQIYYYNKVKYCEQNGWDVYIFSVSKGCIYIDRLRKYEKLINHKFEQYPFMYSKRKIKRLIDWMLDCIDYKDGDEVIIESGDIAESLWGELLAKECGGRHIAYILGEKINVSEKSVYSFFDFKWQRKEFRCIKPKIMQNFFADKNLSEELCYGFRAPCTNSMEDVDVSVKLDLVPNEPTIGVTGRLDKGYVLASLAEIVKFANNHPDKFYNVLFVGGGAQVCYDKIKELSKKAKNINVVITGFLYPVPQKVIEKMTVAIGSSGSIRLPWSLDIPSIAVELDSKRALGFLGYDTQNTLYHSSNEVLRDISDCLEDFFYNSYIENHEGPYVPAELITEQEIKEVLDTHFEYLQQAAPEKEYFVEFKADRLKSRIIKLVYFFGGYGIIRTLKRVKLLLSRI